MQPNFWINFYTAPDPSLWQGRSDALPDEQMYQQIECVNLLVTENSALQKSKSSEKTAAKVISIDFVELAPPLDQPNKTAMLTAALIMIYLQSAL